MSYKKRVLVSAFLFLAASATVFYAESNNNHMEVAAEQEDPTELQLQEEQDRKKEELLAAMTEEVLYAEDTSLTVTWEEEPMTLLAQTDQAQTPSYMKEKYAPVDAANVEYSFPVIVTEEEKNILYRIVMAEAGCEDKKGKILVANVIINRMRSGQFPNTVEGVVFAKGQFSPVASGSYYRVKPTASVREAVERALLGEDYSKGALYFVSKSSSSTWFRDSLTHLLTHGDHLFYK